MRKDRRRQGRKTIIAAAAILLTHTQANAEAIGCRLLPGTYVTTITDIEGVFASRGIVTFLPGGALIVTDSRQGGQTEVYDPFSMGQGTWSCKENDDGATAFSAVTLNFTTPPGSAASKIGRVDYDGFVDPATGGISGNMSLHLSDTGDLEGSHPHNGPGEVAETFHFSSTRVPTR